jgi:8-oxo-dGTP diphosphatase
MNASQRRSLANQRLRDKPLLVVAALIAFENQILVCQRRKDDAFGLKWEFPGGKVRPGEPPRDALARELKEELGAVASIGAEAYRTRHRYSQLAREINLIFFPATLAEPRAIQNLVFEQMQWLAPEKLGSLDFLPADRELVELLSSGKMKIF